MNRYFDNATTSFPKPPAVAEAIADYITNCGGSYGRVATHRTLHSSTMVEHCRDLMALRLGVADADHIFFTLNATMAANTLLKGLNLSKALVSPMEHNAIMRPLVALGVEIVQLPSDSSGMIDLTQDIDTDGVSLVIINLQSNVNGVRQPIEDIAEWAKIHDLPLMVDTSQSLGWLTGVDVDYVIFTGHKGLYGVTGVGGFYAKNPDSVTPLLYGGTGSRSESYLMPEIYPDRFEAGTPNITGIVALKAALENPPEPQHTHNEFLQMLDDINGYQLHVSSHRDCQGELFSITHRHMKPSEIAQRLYSEFGIETRSGLHCSPMAHRTLGTFPHGTVRFSMSPYHTIADLQHLSNSLTKICK